MEWEFQRIMMLSIPLGFAIPTPADAKLRINVRPRRPAHRSHGTLSREAEGLSIFSAYEYVG